MKTVYMVKDEGPLVTKLLREAGFEVLIGDGKCNDEYLAKADALIPGKLRVTEEILEKAPKLKILSKFGVGMDRIDIDACTEKGVLVCNTRLSNYVSVAEHALTLMLMCAKRVQEIAFYLRREEPEWDKAKLKGMELCGKTLAVIGCGNIGRRTALIAHGLEMNVIGYDPFMKPEQFPDYIHPVESMETALKCADVISIHAAGTKETDNLIRREHFDMMKPTAILINTTRGFVVNENDLIDALKNGKIACAGIDVFTNEPVENNNPLLLMDNVVVTPHNAANTAEARVRGEQDCADNIIGFFNGVRPKTAFNGPF